MKAKVIAFFNNKGGVGKTSLVYHLAWMYADIGAKVVAADLDPQANLTSAFLDEDRLLELWSDDKYPKTVLGSIQPILRGTGDIGSVHIEDIEYNLGLIVGDIGLSIFEDELSAQWTACLDGKERAFRVISAFWRMMLRAAEEMSCDVVLIDAGPNLGSINRAVLISADYVVVPLCPDLFSLQGLRNLGPTLREWRKGWQERLQRNPEKTLPLPVGSMKPIGYIVLQHAVRLDRPVRSYERWVNRIPKAYQQYILGFPEDEIISVDVQEDNNCLSMLKHYRSLMPLAQEARKPMFNLKPADGAIGAHFAAVQSAYKDFERLAREIAHRTEITLPQL